MSFTEQAVFFDCMGDSLLGILAKPVQPSDVGVVLIVGGPQYRAGSHRQFVLLSRAVAAAGFAVMRFDYRGMGDSEGEQRDFQAVSADIGAAIGEFQSQVPTVKKIALWGLCDGASAALLYCHATRDARIAGLCLLNPWVRSDLTLAATQIKYYYLQRLAQRAFWTKLLSGKVAFQAFSGLLKNLRVTLAGANSSNHAMDISYQEGMARGWQIFQRDTLLILSGEDYTAKEFVQMTKFDLTWKKALSHPLLKRVDLPGFDHTFSNSSDSKHVDFLTLQWLSKIN